MARLLVSWDEMGAAINALPVVDVAGEPHVDAQQLLDAITGITRGNGLASRGEPPPDLRFATGPKTVAEFARPYTAMSAVENASPLEAERDRLASLPPGKCVCGHLDHTDGECPECGCRDYVDTTVRDPIEAARDRGDVEALRSYGVAPANAGTIEPAISRFENDIFAKPPVHDNAPIE